MELKDVILSTLAEIEQLNVVNENHESKEKVYSAPSVELTSPIMENITDDVNGQHDRHEEEVRILDGIRERLLVLFEGFQSPNNVQIEAKVDLTLNFLEYLLATIDTRLESIKEKV